MNSASNINNNSSVTQGLTIRSAANGNSFNIEAHSSSNMKLDRPNAGVVVSPPLMQTKPLFTPSDAEEHLKEINKDIYEGTQKEKAKHEFDFKRYFTIFGFVALIAGIITYFHKH